MSDLQNVSQSSGSGYAVSGGVSLGRTTAGDGNMSGALEPEQRTVAPTGSAGTGIASGSDQSSTTRSGISGIAGEQSVRTGDGLGTGILIKDWSTKIVLRDVQSQAALMREFNQRAPAAAAEFAAERRRPFELARAELVEADRQLARTDDPATRAQLTERVQQLRQLVGEHQATYDAWKDGGAYKGAVDILIAAAGGGTTTATGAAITREALAWAADQMRQAMIEDSKKFPGICDAQDNCLDNKSGKSVGVNGDGFKLAGGRVNLNELCKENRCKTDNATGLLQLDDRGRVRLNEYDQEGNPINLIALLEANPGWRSPLGGFQGGIGKFLGLGDYAPGSLQDVLAEAYAGTHDTLNSRYWYGSDGNIRDNMTAIEQEIGEALNKVNVLVATPFAIATLLPPDLLNLIIAGSRK